jgi:hypothetical protein
MSSSVQARFDETLSRADAVLRQRVQREEAALAAENADLEAARRVKAHRNAERCREHQARYVDAFESFGVHAPPPIDGERSVDYRDRLWNRLIRKLPPTHEMASVYADDLSTEVMNGLEPRLLAAARQEGLRPSEANLPDGGELIARHRIDSATGERSVEYFGRESFIKAMGAPTRKVAAIVDRSTNQVIWGRPLPQAR